MSALFSIVVLTYNQAKLVKATLESIYQQSYPNIELIISDDGSKDGTPQVVDRWLSQFGERFTRCQFLASTQNTGISANHNRGVKAAKGEFLKYIGGDDILLPDAVKKMTEFLERNPEIQVATSFVQPFLSKEDGEILETLPCIPESWAVKVLENDADTQFHYMSRYCFLPAPGFFFRTESLSKIEYFDGEFRRFEDWHTWLKFLTRGIRIHFFPETTVRWRIHPNSVSTSALYRGDKRFFEENILVYQKYILPFMDRLSPLERVHIKARIRFYRTLMQHGGEPQALRKARLNFLFDPLKWIEFPGWVVKQITRKPMKKIHELFTNQHDAS
jgi:glycosyltransferase involved in cell wall biosynthesis